MNTNINSTSDLLTNIYFRYWPIHVRLIAKQTVKCCIMYCRLSPTLVTPFMVPFLRKRVNIKRSFAKTGVDFGWLILIRSRIRLVVGIKCYMVVYVCFVMCTIHQELVNWLSQSFYSFPYAIYGPPGLL